MPTLFVHAAAPVVTEHVTAELIGESATLAPGATAWLALRLAHAPQWHTYWINPGDSGLPTKLKWSLPPGFVADDIAWPTPKRFGVADLANFGYDGEVLLPVKLHVPADVKLGTVARLGVETRWLVCHEECIPGRATLTLAVPIAAQIRTDPQWLAAFADAHAAQPQDDARSTSARDIGMQIEVSLPGADLGQSTDIDAFAVQTRVVANARPIIAKRSDGVMLTFAKSDYFTSIPEALDLVVVRPSARALRVHAVFASPNPPSNSGR